MMKTTYLSLALLIATVLAGCAQGKKRNIAFRRAVYQSSAANFDQVGHLVTDGITTYGLFDSRWESAGDKNEWIYVDLGVESKLSKIVLHWAEQGWASRYTLQTSADLDNWTTLQEVTDGKGGVETVSARNHSGRYVRLFCHQGTAATISLREMEVYGYNSLHAGRGEQPKPLADGTQYLREGNWRLQRASEVPESDGKPISKPGYDDKNWLPAKVPGTVLMSYLEAGAIPDPNYSDRQLMISDSFFASDFWYRNTFVIPASRKGQATWLNFDGINWKADIYLNGAYVGRIDGAFVRGIFDVTSLARYGLENHLAVRIHKNATPGKVTVQNIDNPGKNGGLLGADNPTIHASVGWDWVPTIRGRNIGIYNEVYLSYTSGVQLRDPWVITDLDTEQKDFSKANLQVRTELYNPTDTEQQVVVKGTIQPGGISFESEPFTVRPKELREVVVKDLTVKDPVLWWPNTYGEQFLYTATLTAFSDNKGTDAKSIRFGIREFTYSMEKPFTVYCNGTRIVCRGGNWGMDDSNLAATEEDYDIKVRLHAEANLTMIRNWVGMTGHEGFYRACDKYGVLIWDDFWLANPGDGPNPNDEGMFARNAVDKVRRNRHHAALVLYCGRNEGDPPRSLNEELDKFTRKYDGTRPYIPHSAAGIVSGWGPYSVQDSEWYYLNTYGTLHSERGMPNVPALESLRKFLPEEHQWPMDDVWGMHDFTLKGAQGGGAFMDKMRRYGAFDDLPAFARTAQMVNYEGHKSIFEAVYTNNSNGMLMWMSQSAWPSMVWQTYDYYYDTNAGYFGIKKANQPVNAIFNFATHEVVLVNATANPQEALSVTVSVFDVQGALHWTETRVSSIDADSHFTLLKPNLSSFDGVLFVKTRITGKDGKEIADNFTWINVQDKYNYQALSQLPQATIQAMSRFVGEDGEYIEYNLTVENKGASPALLLRIKSLQEDSGEQILPVYYSDNYFSLMPGESKEISVKFKKKHLTGNAPVFYIEGWNKQEDKI